MKDESTPFGFILHPSSFILSPEVVPASALGRLSPKRKTR
jgi:hypothetical protein